MNDNLYEKSVQNALALVSMNPFYLATSSHGLLDILRNSCFS